MGRTRSGRQKEGDLIQEMARTGGKTEGGVILENGKNVIAG